MTRIERLQAVLERPLLVTNPANVRYLSGFNGVAALLVEPGRSRLFTDSRFTGAAASHLPELEVVEVDRDLYAGIGRLLQGELAFEAETVTVAGLEKLRSGGAELVPSSGLAEALRAVKDAGELAAIRHAAEITNAAYERLASERFSGRRERDLAWRMLELFRELGADGEAFPTIVASGPNGAFPHAEPGERVVREGDFVVVDAGAAVDGYFADCTRTFACGEPPAKLLRAYGVCLAAHDAGIAALKAGVLAREVDLAARDLIDAGEFAGSFTHATGHGVGIEVHEQPKLRAASGELRLEAGNVVTIEPGIYLEGLGGVRIEDLLVVTGEGAESLTTFSRELTPVG